MTDFFRIVERLVLFAYRGWGAVFLIDSIFLFCDFGVCGLGSDGKAGAGAGAGAGEHSFGGEL